MVPYTSILLKGNPRGAIFWDLTMKQWPELWICFGFISTLSVIFKQQQEKQISLALHCRHCWLIWLTDEYKIISNSFRTDKQMKHCLALNLMENVIPNSVCFPPLLVGHKGHSPRGSVRVPALRTETVRRGWASSPGGRPLSQGVYTLSLPPRAVKWKGTALEQARLCACADVWSYVCRGSNLECAGGYGLFDMTDSPLQTAKPGESQSTVGYRTCNVSSKI